MQGFRILVRRHLRVRTVAVCTGLAALASGLPAVALAQGTARIFVTNEVANSITDVDLATWAVRKTFPAGQDPE